jgi:hypothetical protein
MSSLIRRLAIRMMKRARYTREKWILVKNKRGDLVPQSVTRDGEITDPDDTPIGRDWPILIPARARSATKPQPKNATPRALRKAKPNKRRVAKWVLRAEAALTEAGGAS